MKIIPAAGHRFVDDLTCANCDATHAGFQLNPVPCPNPQEHAGWQRGPKNESYKNQSEDEAGQQLSVPSGVHVPEVPVRDGSQGEPAAPMLEGGDRS